MNYDYDSWFMIIYQWYDRAGRPGTSWHDDLKMMNFKSVLWTLVRSCAGMWAASWSRFSRRSLGQRKCGDWLGRWRVKDGGRASSFSFMALCGVKCGVLFQWLSSHATLNLKPMDKDLDLNRMAGNTISVNVIGSLIAVLLASVLAIGPYGTRTRLHHTTHCHTHTHHTLSITVTVSSLKLVQKSRSRFFPSLKFWILKFWILPDE